MLLTVVENMIPARFGKSFRSPGVNRSVRGLRDPHPHEEEPT